MLADWIYIFVPRFLVYYSVAFEYLKVSWLLSRSDKNRSYQYKPKWGRWAQDYSILDLNYEARSSKFKTYLWPPTTILSLYLSPGSLRSPNRFQAERSKSSRCSNRLEEAQYAPLDHHHMESSYHHACRSTLFTANFYLLFFGALPSMLSDAYHGHEHASHILASPSLLLTPRITSH